MADDIERSSSKKKIQEQDLRIAELEKTVKALLKGMQEAESEVGEPLMPKGVYHGYDFTE